MAGKLYGIGVGPGDPELLTLKAVRIIRECGILAVPGESPKETVAYQIASQCIPQIADRRILGIHMPMTKNQEKLHKAHAAAEEEVCLALEEGHDVGFLTLGDPCIYSTYLYIHKRVQERGYEAQIINGIPSFLAVSARLNEGLSENSQMLHIIPAAYQVEEGLSLKGTKILMKAGKHAKKVRDYLIKEGMDVQAVERCGMEGERIYKSADKIPDDLSYYSIMIVKDREDI